MGGEGPELVRSEPFNQAGDRLLIQGAPGAIQKMAQHRERQERVQAEERILTFLEGIPELLDVLSDETRDQLVGTIRSLCNQTAKDHLLRFFEVAKGIELYLPTFGSIPDPRDLGSLVAKVGEKGGQIDPLSVDSSLEPNEEESPNDENAQAGEGES